MIIILFISLLWFNWLLWCRELLLSQHLHYQIRYCLGFAFMFTLIITYLLHDFKIRICAISCLV